MTGANEIEAAFDFITHNAARALRLEDYGLDPGCRADLNVLAAPNFYLIPPSRPKSTQ